jgi:hypothetical protein
MGPGDAIAAVAFAGVLIAVLIVIGESFKRWVSYKQRRVELEAETRRATLSERSEREEILEERVRVLERIATDRGLDVAHQIESLRERSAASQLKRGEIQ